MTPSRMLLIILFNLNASVSIGQNPYSQERREQWQRVDQIVEAMSVEKGSSVADIGAGRGFLTGVLLKAVGDEGRVFAVDVDSRALGQLKSRFKEMENLRVIKGKLDSPLLPESELDAAVMLDAYHEMTMYESMLTQVKQSLKPGGRLVIVDPISKARKDDTREEQIKHHEISLETVRAEVEMAGFEILRSEESFTKHPYHDQMWILVARRPLKSGTL